MSKAGSLPVALTVAGSDSGGGAGAQADLKTFAALGTHGVSAITCITAQNPRRVLGIQACRPQIVRQQLDAVWEELRPAAAKTGMLYSAAIARAVTEFFKAHPHLPLVVDPVMVSTSGTYLLKPAAIQIVREKLLPRATLVTPNLDEASLLVGKKLRSVEDLRFAAREIYRQFGCAALVKGGHLRGTKEAADIFFDGKNELLLTAPFVRGVRTHGTGCTYSAAITAQLAKGLDLASAVGRGKEFITKAIYNSQRVGKYTVLDSFWR